LFSTIKKWAAEFKHGRTNLEDDPREGSPKSATTPEIIEQVHHTVLGDRRTKVREIVETIGISKECVGCILHEELDMKKLCARWMPHLLTADQNRTRMKISEQCLECLNKNKTDFLDSPLHTRIQKAVKQWTEAGCSVPKKARSVPSAGKVMHGIGVLGC